MSKTVELFFDFSSPNAYFCAMQLPAIAARHGATVKWRPFLLGGLFKSLAVDQTPGMSSANKAAYGLVELERWSDKHRIAFAYPSRFPMNTVKALRVALALDADGADMQPYVEAVYRAYWVEDRDISDEAVLRDILTGLGLDADALVARTADPAIKDALRLATEEVAARGGFGAPTMFVGGQMFFGKDRLDFVEDALSA
jgi:2-hydroxychromene-2-carboxylate isomerase